MKKIFFFLLFFFATVAHAQDLRLYPGPERGVVIMGADIPPSWFVDVWVNPVMADGKPQGLPNIVFAPHPSYRQRNKDCDAGKDTGSVVAYVEAWEYDRAGNRIVRAVKYPIIQNISYVPDYSGYHWRIYIGLSQLGINQFYSPSLIPPIWTPPCPRCPPRRPCDPHYPPHPPHYPRR